MQLDCSYDRDVRQLLTQVSRLPQLVAIGLDRCFYTDSMFHRFRESVKPDTTVDQPSRLTGPTFLCLRDNTIARKDVGVKCRQGAAADEDAAAPVGIQRG